jgi:hypothetical protein
MGMEGRKLVCLIPIGYPDETPRTLLLDRMAVFYGRRADFTGVGHCGNMTNT